MSGVLDNQPDIVVVGKFDSRNNITGPGNVERVAGVVVQKTGLMLLTEGITALVLEVGTHSLGRGIYAAGIRIW